RAANRVRGIVPRPLDARRTGVLSGHGGRYAGVRYRRGFLGTGVRPVDHAGVGAAGASAEKVMRSSQHQTEELNTLLPQSHHEDTKITKEHEEGRRCILD